MTVSRETLCLRRLMQMISEGKTITISPDFGSPYTLTICNEKEECKHTHNLHISCPSLHFCHPCNLPADHPFSLHPLFFHQLQGKPSLILPRQVLDLGPVYLPPGPEEIPVDPGIAPEDAAHADPSIAVIALIFALNSSGVNPPFLLM